MGVFLHCIIIAFIQATTIRKYQINRIKTFFLYKMLVDFFFCHFICIMKYGNQLNGGLLRNG